MIQIDDHSTIGATLAAAARRYGANPRLAVPANPIRAYHPQGHQISFDAARGHRIGLLLEKPAS